MRAHDGLKYQYEYCSKTFAIEKNCKYHLSTYTGQCRFKCNICNKGFKAEKQYDIHTKTHKK